MARAQARELVQRGHTVDVVSGTDRPHDGVDVEHAEREPAETSPSCRYYNTLAGWKPLPEKGMVVRAIQRAQTS